MHAQHSANLYQSLAAAQAVAEVVPDSMFCWFYTEKSPDGQIKKKPLNKRDDSVGKQTDLAVLVKGSELPSASRDKAEYWGLFMQRPTHHPDGILWVLDVDYKRATTTLSPVIKNLVAKAKEFGMLRERSYSGRGAHIFFVAPNDVTIPAKIVIAPGQEIEVFGHMDDRGHMQCAKSLMLTGIDLAGEVYSYPDARGLLESLGLPGDIIKKPERVHVTQPRAFTPRDEFRDVEEILAWVHCYDDYDEWLKVGMAIKAKMGDAGFSSWDRWSAQSSKYDPEIMREKWASFKSEGINFGSVVVMAKAAGYKPQTREKTYNPPPSGNSEPAKPRSLVSDLFQMKTTDQMMEKIESAEFVFENLIVQGHICAFISKPNGGKTTIMTYAASRIAALGYQVLYVNVDAGAADLKNYHAHASKNGYTLIAPDMVEGKSAKDVVTVLEGMAQGNEDLSNYVIIFDTLKKFTEVMNKTQGKVFYSLLRKLTAIGMTAVLLGHTNKYEDENGKPIYEGTGDLKNDIDELIYLVPIKHDDGSMTVSTIIDKERAVTKNTTFQISAQREVMILDDYVDTLEQTKAMHQVAEDQSVISFILENLQLNCRSLTQLHEISKTTKAGFSRQRLHTVLTRYCDDAGHIKKWSREPSMTQGYTYFVKK